MPTSLYAESTVSFDRRDNVQNFQDLINLDPDMAGFRLRPEPDYPAGAGTGTGIPVPVSRNRIWILKFRFRFEEPE